MAAVSGSRRRLCICWETADSRRAADGLRLRFAGIDLLAVDLLAVDLLAVDLLAADLLAVDWERMCSEGVGSEFAVRCSGVRRLTAGEEGRGGSTRQGAREKLP